SVWEATEYFSTHVAPEPTGSAHRMSAPYQAVRCADGYITIAAANDRLFRRLCELLDRPAWLECADYQNDTPRVTNRRAPPREIEAVTIDRPRKYWLDLFEANGLPCGPINNYEQVFADAHIRPRGLVGETDHPPRGGIP